MNQVNNLYVKEIIYKNHKPNHGEVRQEVFLNRFLALLLALLQVKPSCTQQRPSSPRRMGPGEATPGSWLCWSMAGHLTTWSRPPHWPENPASTSSLCPSPNLRPRSLTWCQTSTSWRRSHLYSHVKIFWLHAHDDFFQGLGFLTWVNKVFQWESDRSSAPPPSGGV